MRFSALLTTLLFTSGLAVSQDTRSAEGVLVRGTVHDASGAALPKAKLKLKLSNGTDEEGVKTTAESGVFAFEHVAPGDYVLKTEAKGFETTATKIKVRSKPVENVAVILEVAGEAASVTVSASRKNEDANVNMDRNADQLSFEKQNLEDLPTQDQNPLALVSSFTSPASQGAEGLNVLVDGVEMSASSLPAGSIRRIRVNHNPYSARFRRPGKGRVEVLTEEGSMRRLRGGFTYSARNSLFDARDAFANTRPDLDRRMFAGNFSAPIVKQKATFFVTAEHLEDNATAVVNALTLRGPLVANVSTPSQRTSMLSRFDWKPTDRTTLSALYTLRDESQDNRGVGSFRRPEQGIPEAQRQHRLQVSGSSVLTNHLINEVRVSLDREDRALGRLAAEPAIIVNGAFTGGAPQSFRSREETGVRFQDVATYYAGRHCILFGAEYRPGWYTAVDRSNFGGAFEFASLSDFAVNRPFVFSQNQGNPAVSFMQSEAFGFAQDEIRLRPSLTVTAGFRDGWQSNVSHPKRLAPRLSFAYALADQKTVLRGGAGWFQERVSDEITRDSLLYDGNRVREIVISQPSFPNVAAALAAAIPSSTIRVSNDLQLPALFQASMAVEREVWKRASMTMEYQTTRGMHLLRSHDINAPLPSALTRPDPRFLNINQVESAGALRGNALTVTWRGAMRKWFSGMAQYTLSKTEDNTSGPFFLPANNFDFGPERGRSDFDQRHRFNLAGTADVPGAFRLGVLLTLGSGVPFNITTGRDDNGDTVAADRPAGFTRNTGEGPGLARLDVRLTKLLRGPRLFDRGRDHTSYNVEISANAFNAFNHVNFTNFVGVQNSPFFGRANGALPPRVIQLSLRYRL